MTKFSRADLNAAFKKDYPCLMKKKPCLPVIIVDSSDKGKGKWLVEFVNPDGTRNGVTQVATSKQLKKLTDNDSHPLVKEVGEEDDEEINEEEAVSTFLVAGHIQPETSSSPSFQESEGSLDAAETSLLDNSVSQEVFGVQDGPEEEVEHETRNDSDNESEDEEVDPDLENEEDLGPYRPDDEEGEDDGDDLNFRAIAEEQAAEDKHREKWNRYLTEKAALIEMGSKVKCNPPKHQGIDVGSQVQQRRAPRRTGYVIASNRDEDHGYACWEVEYEDETVKFVKSTELICVKDDRVFEWTYVDDVFPINPVLPFRETGVVGYNFAAFKKENLDTTKDDYGFPFLTLLQHLWPGDWLKHLNKLNTHLGSIDQKLLSGIKLFEKGLFDYIFTTVNFGVNGLNLMSHSRFKMIYANISQAFYDDESTNDPWHPITGLIDSFNRNRKKNIASGSKIVLDESMSPYKPRTTKTSLLPHLSFILRKPKPLGVEYKNVICAKTGILLFQEVQRGKEAMRKSAFSRQIGTNAACAIRLILGSVYSGEDHAERAAPVNQERRYLVTADSWFGSPRLAETIKLLWRDEDGQYRINRSRGENPNAHELIASVKSNSGWFPKHELKKRMKHFPSGSHLVMRCRTPGSNIELFAIGYKYNLRKILFFIMTRNAGQTTPGPKPYIAKFPDNDGNVKERHIKRPQVLSDYFEDSDAIDSHNHCRQHRLGLEKFWLTQNPWVRNDCTLIGMTAIDAYRAVKHQVPELSRDKQFTVAAFAKGLTYDCLYNKFYDDAETTDPSMYLEADNLTQRERKMKYALQLHCEKVNAMNKQFLQQASEVFFKANLPSVVNANELSTVGSPLSMSVAGPSADVVLHECLEDAHELVDIEISEKQGRVMKRKCRICKTGIRMQCSNPRCLVAEPQKLGHPVGTPICPPRLGARKLKDYPNNTLTCLEIHRREEKAKRMEEMRLKQS
ncbi:hypothetical protein FisN_9Lu068 [Fistulifera solaris]|uniref:PiggyBac transposable element-derived protein domain-containing protein n=1 Tax=Fistulifera solaris TaxID=1519565 RepID=A0A1Z5KKR6_FISSO|nr:hypothetical protein FisN_9Lu068 [Fistulifera solaris]|eukprot:GAX26777.1 hypothetical protein FisN_9Lu068 [Fistulifera solaris]